MSSDALLPDPDLSLARARVVQADPERTYRAIRHAPLEDDPIVRGVTWLQRLPERVIGWFEGTPPEPEISASTLGELLENAGCRALIDEPGQRLTYGAVGRFWDPRAPRMGPLNQAGFEAFDRDDSARCTITFTLISHGDDKTLLVLEVKAEGTDAKARRSLERFGRFVEPALSLVVDRALDRITQTAVQLAQVGRLTRTRTRTRTPARPRTPGRGRPPTAGSHGLPTLETLDLDGQRVLLRVDVNAPLEDGRITARERLEAAATSIQALLDAGAGVAVLGHQGRPDGTEDAPLQAHAEVLAEVLDRGVTYLPHIADKDAPAAVRKLAAGEVLVLENVRHAPGEMEPATPAEHAKRGWVHALADAADAYVNDAFSVSHRPHASIIGFPQLLPAAAGPGLIAELDGLSRLETDATPSVAVLGGTDLGPTLDLVGHQLSTGKLDRVLLGGLPGLLALEGAGHDTGEGTRALLEAHGGRTHLKSVRALLDEHEGRIHLPEDVAVPRSGDRLNVPVEELPADGRLMDIGANTRDAFLTQMQGAQRLIVHGPLGVYEEPPFDKGTRAVLTQAVRLEGVRVVGGGHTVAAINRFGLDPSRFDHVSLGGGAMLAYLADDPLPGLQALEATLTAQPSPAER